VTGQLNEGKNVVGVILGNGWAGSPKAILQLNIDYDDGTREEVVTDWGKGWDVARGPIVYNSIYDGEDYDAREEKDGWDTAAYDMASVWQRPGGWILATIVEDPGGSSSRRSCNRFGRRSRSSQSLTISFRTVAESMTWVSTLPELLESRLKGKQDQKLV